MAHLWGIRDSTSEPHKIENTPCFRIIAYLRVSKRILPQIAENGEAILDFCEQLLWFLRRGAGSDTRACSRLGRFPLGSLLNGRELLLEP